MQAPATHGYKVARPLNREKFCTYASKRCWEFIFGNKHSLEKSFQQTIHSSLYFAGIKNILTVCVPLSSINLKFSNNIGYDKLRNYTNK